MTRKTVKWGCRAFHCRAAQNSFCRHQRIALGSQTATANWPLPSPITPRDRAEQRHQYWMLSETKQTSLPLQGITRDSCEKPWPGHLALLVAPVFPDESACTAPTGTEISGLLRPRGRVGAPTAPRVVGSRWWSRSAFDLSTRRFPRPGEATGTVPGSSNWPPPP